MMSWMNNTNAFVYFILYIHHKIGLHEGEGGVAASGRAWVKYVKESFCLTMSGLNDRDTEARTALDDGATNQKDRRGAKVLVKRFVLVLGSLHLAVMAALGIWLWSNLQLFGLGNRRPADFEDANTCAVNGATVAVFGQGVSLGSPTLRAFAIAIYSLFLIPGVNLIAPMIIFLVAYPSHGASTAPFRTKMKATGALARSWLSCCSSYPYAISSKLSLPGDLSNGK
ncbi:hypothetical protein BKA70DRAFT_790009 [Coprinopsis sp. MPI-PUGE-AT-0042]|nr:hypothetical protein BKA70DRAFT_790009 [Coprinopsis sp. MPI-PUGE-AT-0042]